MRVTESLYKKCKTKHKSEDRVLLLPMGKLIWAECIVVNNEFLVCWSIVGNQGQRTKKVWVLLHLGSITNATKQIWVCFTLFVTFKELKCSLFTFVYLQCLITAQNVRTILKVDSKSNFVLNWTIWGSKGIPYSYIILFTQVSSHYAKFQEMSTLRAMWGFRPLPLLFTYSS